MKSPDQLSDVRILLWTVRGWFPADVLDLVDCVHLCRVKLFRNSRVLGYGRLNGHVASIVSMFSKRKFWKGFCICEMLEKGNVPVRYWKSELCTCEVRMMKSRKLFYKKFCKEKYSFLKTILSKPRWYVISTRETILFLKYLFQQRYRYDKQPWWIFHLSWVVNHYL